MVMAILSSSYVTFISNIEQKSTIHHTFYKRDISFFLPTQCKKYKIIPYPLLALNKKYTLKSFTQRKKDKKEGTILRHLTNVKNNYKGSN